MRYRKHTATGDYMFGRQDEFFIDSPEAVAQAIKTRLLLMTGEWFLDSAEGTDYSGQILGYGTADTRDIEIRQRIINTAGVVQILEYSSKVVDREFSVTCRVETSYGQSTPFTINF